MADTVVSSLVAENKAENTSVLSDGGESSDTGAIATRLKLLSMESLMENVKVKLN